MARLSCILHACSTSCRAVGDQFLGASEHSETDILELRQALLSFRGAKLWYGLEKIIKIITKDLNPVSKTPEAEGILLDFVAVLIYLYFVLINLG